MEVNPAVPESTVEYSSWAPLYRRIAEEFAFPFEAEEASANLLLGLLPREALDAPSERLRSRLAGRDAVVVGLAPGIGAPPIGKLAPSGRRAAIVAADGAADRCLRGGLVPDVIVTDLDGPVAAEASANARGALVVVHAHGDNRPQLRTWVPQFPGSLVGSWAGAPRGGLVNFGGFTDGDRAVYLAEAMGAERLLLFGFDFERVEEIDPMERARKSAKLGWARKSIDHLAAHSRVPIYLWRADGAQSPWQLLNFAEVPSGPSTQ
jgi:hypothetical protein